MNHKGSKVSIKRRDTRKLLLDQQFKLPDNFQSKVHYLEELLNCGKFTKDNSTELIGLYTVYFIFY